MCNERDNEFVFALLDSAARIQRRLDGSLSNARGISFSEYRLLLALSSFHNASAMRVELAGAVGLTPSAVTRALKPLEKLGYVTTEKSDRDARRALARLTRGGEELLSDATLIVNDVIASLALERADHEQWVRLLDAIARRGRTSRRPS